MQQHWLDTYYGRVGAAKAKPPADKQAVAMAALSAEKKALENAGYNTNQLNWNLIKDYMESGAFTNGGYLKHNNPGNITYSKNDKYATKGTAMPGNPGYYWAHYKSLDDYAQGLKRILNIKPGIPWEATGGKDYVHRLKLNNYFGKESEDSYLKKLQAANDRLTLIQDLDTDTHQTIVTPDAKHSWWSDLPWYGKGGIILAGLVVVRQAFK